MLFDLFVTVPFAAAPIGQLRWRPPVDFPCPWSGVRNGSLVPPSCVHQRGDGDEDCLFLNIVTPVDVTQTSLLPVLVYYHGTLVYLCSFVSALSVMQYLLHISLLRQGAI